MVIWDFVFRALFGLFIIIGWAYILVFIDWLSLKVVKKMNSNWFVLGIWTSIFAISWMMCYGVGSFVIDLFCNCG